MQRRMLRGRRRRRTARKRRAGPHQRDLRHRHREFGWVTPTIGGKMCAYGYKDEKGIIKCAIEQAYYDGKTTWKKPISCHLYPIKISKTRAGEVVNYEPRETLCRPGCINGKKLKVPAYVFLKESLIRKYGEEFYRVLEKVAAGYFKEKEKK
jgi:hypothetical protein